MAITSASLMRWKSKKVDIVAEIPDYALLFYHNVSKWEDDNLDTHGAKPRENGIDDIFYVYPLSILATPDIVYKQEPDITPTYGKMNYIVRCVDSSTNWPQNCDIRYSACTELTDKHGTLFTSGGRHGTTTLLGRPKPTTPVTTGIPRLKTELPENVNSTNPLTKVKKYNSEHTGHIHRSENLRSTILSSIPSYKSDPTNDINFISNLSLCAIFKNPKKTTEPITTFPKNTLVFYYGDETLESTYFEPNYSHPKPSKNVGNLYVPISLMPGEGVACVHTGIQNYNETIGTDTMVINISSNTAGYHDHLNIQVELASPGKAPSPQTGRADSISNISGTGHKHNVKYNLSVYLKSKLLKTYLTKSNLAPIVDGIIIGYTIGKYSGYNGNPTDGVNILPPNWYFCDGTNGTPDLRGYYPFTNFENDPSGELLSETNEIVVSSIEVENVPWIHNHIIDAGITTDGNPGFSDAGSHTTTYDSSATRHSHGVDTSPQYFDPPVNTPDATRRFNVRVGDIFPYTPPTVDIAFIMFKGGVVVDLDPPAPPPEPPAPSTSACARTFEIYSNNKTLFNTIDIGIESRIITVTGSLTGGPVYGSDAYTWDSDMNKAAVHSGLVSVGETAQIRQWLPQNWSTQGFTYNDGINPPVSNTGYYASTRNGVTTLSQPSPTCGVLLRRV